MRAEVSTTVFQQEESKDKSNVIWSEDSGTRVLEICKTVISTPKAEWRNSKARKERKGPIKVNCAKN